MDAGTELHSVYSGALIYCFCRKVDGISCVNSCCVLVYV